jgi:hypothetical protein
MMDDRHYVGAAHLSRTLAGCVVPESFSTNDVQWVDDGDARPGSFEPDDTFSFERMLVTVAGVKMSACPFVSIHPQTHDAAIDVGSPLRIDFLLGDAERDIGDQSRPMLSVYVRPDGSLTTYEGSAGERVLPIAWLERCRQIKDGLVTPAPVHVESTMPDAHRVAPLDDAADLGL